MTTPPATDQAARPDLNMVWVIGLNRTGTTSLAHALYLLGLPNLHYPDAEHMLRADYSVLDGWRGGSDLSVAGHYRELDLAFPGSRFVLSTRDENDWLRSVTKHFERVPVATDAGASGAMRRKVYGAPRPTESQFRAAWARHHSEVRAYFAGRDDLIEMDVANGDGWEALCPFVGLDVPAVPFPNTNRADGRDAHGSLEAVEMHRDAAMRLRGKQPAA